jgi:hypothetical protein
VGEHWRFITLTSPTVRGASLLEGMKVYQRAWSLLRKRQWWRSYVRGGVKGVEWTEGETGDGYHVHMHLLVCGRWIERERLRDEWTECISEAWRECGHELQFNTRTNAAIVDVRLVRNKRGHNTRATVSLEHALQEVCKYVCKGEAWDSVPDTHLVEVAEVERWPRLFELFGATRDAARMSDEQRRSAEFREREAARLAAWIESDPRGREKPSLDTQYISDGQTVRDGPTLQAVKVTRERGPTLRALSVSLDRSTWLVMLSIRVADARAYRRAMLIESYPCATFVTLNGVAFGEGVESVEHPVAA